MKFSLLFYPMPQNLNLTIMNFFWNIIIVHNTTYYIKNALLVLVFENINLMSATYSEYNTYTYIVDMTCDDFVLKLF